MIFKVKEIPNRQIPAAETCWKCYMRLSAIMSYAQFFAHVCTKVCGRVLKRGEKSTFRSFILSTAEG